MQRTLLALLVLVLLTAGTAFAEKQTYLDYASNLMLTDTDLEQMPQQMELFKQAGLSYQSNLKAPASLEGKTDEQLRVLMGMYFFDANYSLVFGKMKDSITVRKFIRNDLLPRFPRSGEVFLDSPDPKLIKQLMRNPSDQDNLNKLRHHRIAQVRKLAAKASKDEEFTEIMVEGLYGAVIQGVYVASTTAKDMPITPQLEQLFMSQKTRLEFMNKFLSNIQDEHIQTLLDTNNRSAVISHMLTLLTNAQGKLTPQLINTLHSYIVKERNKYVGPSA